MPTTNKVQVENSTTTAGTSTTTNYQCPYTRSKAEQGWECPRCGRINAPWVRSCDCSGNNWSINWTNDKFTTGDKPEWWRDYITYCQADDITKNPNIYQVGGSDYRDGNIYSNLSSTQTNKSNATTVAWNSALNTQTIHTGKTNYKE